MTKVTIDKILRGAVEAVEEMAPPPPSIEWVRSQLTLPSEAQNESAQPVLRVLPSAARVSAFGVWSSLNELLAKGRQFALAAATTPVLTADTTRSRLVEVPALVVEQGKPLRD